MSSSNWIPAIDLVVLSRTESALRPEVSHGIESQEGVRLILHRIAGDRSRHDPNRWAAIARARNRGKHYGTSPWLMFLDDDVVLLPNCVRVLWDGLQSQSEYAAFAADYLHEAQGRTVSRHVAMGATLFRRTALEQIEFRWAAGKCECLCCCQDLRRKRMGIAYLPLARARHIDIRKSDREIAQPTKVPLASAMGASAKSPVYVMAAFDRRHRRKFQHRFISSLRASGNSANVLAFGYGLYPSERCAIERLPGVQLISKTSNAVSVAVHRLLDFQTPLERLPDNAIVAYWDAGDVIFQESLSELWDLVATNPDRLLVVQEPWKHPENGAVAKWTLSIADPRARKYAFDLLATRPYFNAGFAAATATTMLRYLKAAHAMRHSDALRGTSDWGDQTAMNLYCHSQPDRYLEVDDRWNYCLCGRYPNDYRLLADGRFVRQCAQTISVVHGNASRLDRFAFRQPSALALASRSSKLLV